ncbi:MAG: DegT/DnrJ/EryC1/StrS family aminotransferase [Anaerolineales bacterium]|uniref:DegT/DnrJ/EryC1/StrS family aminotransferase n=1 Tax=Candidatus Desulfolinea nitratireducens TaxID=2841698 RepID=A0A8J6NN44_9CHLR|nr:DegT/DnrJ/EryC1/StrS family aminotransferase [Candidatus Desulfolinea nitratireducens]
MIRLTIPSIEDDDLQATHEALASGFLVQGARVAEFESSIADYIGVKHAIVVSNCTAALHLSLLALDVRAGDLVLVTTYSWPATANVIELCGALPVFVDIQPDTFNIDPEALATTLNSLMAVTETAQHVKAILPVHTFGQMADMAAIIKVAEQFDIPVIEDSACALGAKWEGRNAGTWGKMGCFSFHPRKAITTGEGGAITTNDDQLARKLRALRNHGQDPEAAFPDFIMPGFNYRMTEFQAAFGSSQLKKLDRIITARRRLAHQYNNLLENDPVLAPFVPSQSFHVYQSYVTLLPEEAAPHRAEIIRRLKELGIETNIGTWHMPLTTYFRTRYGHSTGDFPISEDIFSRTLTLPLYEALTSEDQNKVVDYLQEMIRK